jgi:hypothetical protein
MPTYFITGSVNNNFVVREQEANIYYSVILNPTTGIISWRKMEDSKYNTFPSTTHSESKDIKQLAKTVHQEYYKKYLEYLKKYSDKMHVIKQSNINNNRYELHNINNNDLLHIQNTNKYLPISNTKYLIEEINGNIILHDKTNIYDIDHPYIKEQISKIRKATEEKFKIPEKESTTPKKKLITTKEEVIKIHDRPISDTQKRNLQITLPSTPQKSSSSSNPPQTLSLNLKGLKLY